MELDVRPVVGYEGLYLVDSIGNVISMPKVKGRYLQNKYEILSPKVTNNGYLAVTLVKDSESKTLYVHRLVAQAFLPNPYDLPQVNHKNGMKQDNRIENLEWVTCSENTKHAYKNNIGGFADISKRGLEKMNWYNVYIKVTLIKGDEVLTFNSTREAGAFLGTNKDNVSNAIKYHGTVKGYKAFGEKRANGES